MSDHETTLRAIENDLLWNAETRAAARAGADALRREKEIAEAVHYYTGEDVDVLVLRYRDEHAPTEPTR